MQNQQETVVNKRPEKMYIESTPVLDYSGTIEIGQKGELDNLMVDCLQIKNLTQDGEDYYAELFNSNTNGNAQLLIAANNNNYLFIAKDNEGKIRVYVSPDVEFSQRERALIEVMKLRGLAKQISEWVPFTSSDNLKYLKIYNQALLKFFKLGIKNNRGKRLFESTVGSIAA